MNNRTNPTLHVEQSINKMPWGYFIQQVLTENYQVKELHLEPNSCSSYHYHKLVNEIWYIWSGNVRTIIGKEEKDFSNGGLLLIPKGTIHRLFNVGQEQAVIVEVQIGNITNDDIYRVQDNYGRENDLYKEIVQESNTLVSELQTDEINIKLNQELTDAVNKPPSNAWGDFLTFLELNDSRIRFIMMNKGSRLSYHYHQSVDEVWLILEGSVWAYVGDHAVICNAGDILHKPRNVKHHCRNYLKGITKILEIQIGANPNILNDVFRLNIKEIESYIKEMRENGGV